MQFSVVSIEVGCTTSSRSWLSFSRERPSHFRISSNRLPSIFECSIMPHFTRSLTRKHRHVSNLEHLVRTSDHRCQYWLFAQSSKAMPCLLSSPWKSFFSTSIAIWEWFYHNTRHICWISSQTALIIIHLVFPCANKPSSSPLISSTRIISIVFCGK